MNNVVLQGRLVKDPEIKVAEGYKFCNFTIAVNRYDTMTITNQIKKSGKQTCDFIDITRNIMNDNDNTLTFKKGEMVRIEGPLRITTSNMTGSTKLFVKVIAKSAEKVISNNKQDYDFDPNENFGYTF